jgi:hypothetical protein
VALELEMTVLSSAVVEVVVLVLLVVLVLPQFALASVVMVWLQVSQAVLSLAQAVEAVEQTQDLPQPVELVAVELVV